MSKRFTPHFGADPGTGVRVLAQPGGEAATWSDGPVPADAKPGYEPSCIHQRKSSAGLFVNMGTKLSALFRRVLVSTDDVALTATAAELNQAADMSTRVIQVTTTPLVLTVADHHNKKLVLNKTDGLAITLPDASPANVGFKVEMMVLQTIASASTVKSSRSLDIMIGHAIMGNNSDNTVVNFQATAGGTFDTINLLGTGNSTGGMAGQRMTFECIGESAWEVFIVGDAAGSEATPFENTVA